jgi:hypothetical protein
VLDGFLFPADAPGVNDERTTMTFTGPFSKLTGDQCDEDGTAADPIFVPAVCGLPGQPPVPGSYQVVAGTGVKYTLKINGIDQGDVEVGTYFVNTFPTKVEITAVALDGFVLDPNATSYWPFDFVAPTLCQLPDLDLVTPEVSSKGMTCTTNGSYTIGGANVVWTVNGQEKDPGTYPVSSSQKIELVAAPGEGHGFDPEQQTEWELTFTKPVTSGCDLTTLAFTGTDALMVGGGAAFLLLGAGTMILGRRKTA